MKKIMSSFMGILLSFAATQAATTTESTGIADLQIAQIALVSEPIDVFANGQMQTLILTPQESAVEIPREFGLFAKTFQLVIDPNECETRNGQTRCSEVGSRTYLAKIRNRHEIILFAPASTPDQSEHEIQEVNGFGQPIKLTLEIVRQANDPGLPRQSISIVISDRKGTRRAKMTPFMRF